ncbi:L-histidine N(alpha)-methyltransferase [bacterium]|nr:L-histidine N(alpha)-methyltransferase [bacterium]MCI0616196.1 L-histidine N(alpha)-methyltransferase [bacterium]
MSATYKVLDHKDLSGLLRLKQTFALDVLVGLSERRKTISSKYFYDEEGSRLFQQIMHLPEYYLTRCEFEILERSGPAIADFVANQKWNLVELGPGDGLKTNLLLIQFLHKEVDFQYVPIDISESALQNLVNNLQIQIPRLEVRGLVSDYFNGLKWLNKLKADDRKNFVLFLGSNIGNFNYSRARVFLRSLWNSLNHDDLVLIGFDLKKDINLMLAAYNDSKGITAKFNLNLLNRINRELGGNFEVSRFQHFANYDVFSGAMESYLVSQAEQKVFIEEIGQIFYFSPWEPIHTEYSYKFLQSDIESLAAETGYLMEKEFCDSHRYFSDCIWRVHKPGKL